VERALPGRDVAVIRALAVVAVLVASGCTRYVDLVIRDDASAPIDGPPPHPDAPAADAGGGPDASIDAMVAVDAPLHD